MRTPALPSPRRRGLVGLTVAALVVSPLAFGLASPASADVSTKIATFPYAQAWSTQAPSPSTTSGPACQASRATSARTSPRRHRRGPADADRRERRGQPTPMSSRTQANPTPPVGGVVEFDGTDTDRDPGQRHGRRALRRLPPRPHRQDERAFAFNARDLDGSVDDAVQQIAFSTASARPGPSPTSLPATSPTRRPSARLRRSTARSVALPAAVNDQASVFVRVITTNAAGNDEWVGIDDVSITADGGTSALSLTNPGAADQRGRHADHAPDLDRGRRHAAVHVRPPTCRPA